MNVALFYVKRLNNVLQNQNNTETLIYEALMKTYIYNSLLIIG